MYNVNMAGWGLPKPPVVKKDWVPPERCTFCNKEIEEGDYLNAGYDRYMIYAETCDRHYCKQWLEHKVRRRK